MSTAENHHDFAPPAPRGHEAIPEATEYFRLSNGEQFIEAANYAEALTETEAEQIASAFQRVSDFTEGKIFTRVSAIDLMPAEYMDDTAQQGDFDPDSGKVRINLSYVRHLAQTADPGFSSFREKYFPDTIITPLQINLGHELFHSIDLQDIDEVNAHGIDKDKTVPGWRSRRGKTVDFSAFMSPDLNGETRELPLTPRAMMSPREDFAESGAIAALGGDISSIPVRAQLLKETIEQIDVGKLDIPSNVVIARAA